MKIPRGWRRLKTGSRVKKGDRIWARLDNRWIQIISNLNCITPVKRDEVIIRKVRHGR